MSRALYHLTVIVALVCFGVWMLVASYEPRPAAAVWVGGVSHHSIFLPDSDNARYELSSAVITQPGDRP